MGKVGWHEEPVWFNDGRRSRRWSEERTALIKFEMEEYFGKLRDVSLDGVGLTLEEAEPAAGQPVEVSVAFDDRVITMAGHVVYRRANGAACRVGVACPALSEEVCDYLRDRYDGVERSAFPA